LRFVLFAMAATFVAYTSVVQCQELEQHQGLTRDPVESRVERRAVPREVMALYDTLAVLPLRDQRTLLRQISPKAKSDLWIYNMQRFIQENRTLSIEQRQIINECLTFVDIPDVFEMQPDSPGWDELQRKLHDFTERAEAAFTLEDFASLFLRLGTEPLAALDREQDLPPIPLRWRLEPQSRPHCDCAEFWDCWPLSYYCTKDPELFCLPNLGCGVVTIMACTGLCT
jgi:hypothetical protein